MSDASDFEVAELNARLLKAQLERAAAARELQAALIEPSPADVEAYVAATPARRRWLMMQWAILNASYD